MKSLFTIGVIVLCGLFAAASSAWAGDSDGDGVDDAIDNCPSVPNPGQQDGDGDGVGDVCDNCPSASNPDQLNTDSDAVGNVCDDDDDNDGDYDVVDNCPLNYDPTQADSDGDGAGDVCDNCPGFNPGQEDNDGDGMGDVCDGDDDNDGAFDVLDNCPWDYNPGQEDIDVDGVGDACAECVDIDGDGFGNPGYPASTCPVDNCPGVPNPGQESSDGDGLGDACDNCPAAPNPDQTDADSDTFGAACDCNDASPTMNPAAAETWYDGIDQDCDSRNDFDADFDGFVPMAYSAQAGGSAPGAGDCNDADANVHPGATEVPDDGVDQDCNGFDAISCFQDADHDGYGTSTVVIAPDGQCDVAQGESTVDVDCDDTSPTVFPGAPEIPNDGIDQNCDGRDGCCIGRVGNANGQGEYPDELTLGDIMLLVDVKFVSGDCGKLPCIEEADANQDGGANPTCEDNITLGDIMSLVNFLFIASPGNATLPECL